MGCSTLYYMTITGACEKYKDIKYLINGNSIQFDKKVYVKEKRKESTSLNNEKFICKNGKVIDKMLLNDLVFDCGSEGDEPVLMSLLIHDISSFCTEPQMIPCKEGHSRCYWLRDICIYKLNRLNHLNPCRTGGHLQNCKKFECNAMFKCIDSYCVSWSYVCDGKWDCPAGDDELNNPVCTKNQVCIYMYKCKNTTQRCLHLKNKCDGTKDCPL